MDRTMKSWTKRPAIPNSVFGREIPITRLEEPLEREIEAYLDLFS